MLGQSGGHRLRLSKLNDQLTCKLCGGYFIDATTIIECLHSFCRSCIVKYLESNKYCPICEVQVHKSRPLLNIRPDHTLQDIVYKLVPGCYQNEMKCRREFYSKHPEVCIQTMSPEARGEPIESHIYSPDESLSLSLEYFNPCTKDVKESSTKALLRRYLRCPAAVTVFHLQKLIRAKYGLTDAHRVDVMYKEEPLCSSYTLMDVMYIYHWRRKVPLHLSYRIFETSPKRLKLSEDNVDYKMSLLDAGINSVELKEEKGLKREWKEVQLKISETGVMSITDISDQQYNRNTKLEETIGSFGNIDASTGHCELNKTLEKKEQSLNNLPKDGSNDRNKQVADDNTASLNSKNIETSTNGTDTKPNLTTEDIKIITRLNPEEKEMKDYPNNNNVDIKPVLQKTIQPQETTQPADEKPNIVNSNNIEDVNQKQAPVNNNNNNTIVVESKQEIRKSNSKNDIKIINAGAKIDALSVKLQFQPKSGQLGNTYSKKLLKDKKVLSYSTKKVDTAKTIESTRPTETKNSLDISKSKVNSGTTSNSSIPCPTKIGQQNSTFGATEVSEAVGTAEVSKPTEAIALTHASAMTNVEQNEKETREKNTQIPGHDRCSLQEQKVPERKPNSHIEIIIESPKVGNEQEKMSTTGSQKTSYVQNDVSTNDEIIIPVSSAVPTSTANQTSTAYPYTVQDLVNTALLKNSLKNLATSTPQKLPVSNQETTVTACTLSESTVFNMQSTMSTSLKNSFPNQGVSISKQQPSKMNFEITGVYSVPPCPDAIPISLMKPAIRKNELIAKSSNLNEICAKIGASGSKINDICAKIGENSKEKSKTEARNKSDIPDLLKIGRKNDSPSNTIDNVNKQQHSNIPNVPVYSPNNSAVTTANKNVYSTVKSNTRATSLLSVSPVVTPHALQKVSSSSTSKKQSQAVGYKTLRDPPRCWNPTLSKNNYVAVKNQSKEMQNQPQQAALSERSKPIQSKPAKIFKMRNIPRYLGNPASGVKPIYGIGNESKEKEQSATTTTTSSKNPSLNMMKIDPKTLSPIVSTVNSPIVSPPPYSPSARNYQTVPFSRDICRNTGSPISPKNSPVNMLSTNPFIPSPTPNTNPRLIYSHFPPPFPDASRFPNPLIRSPIGIPPPSAFHSSLPPSINKLYQRSSYIPQTTGFSQPPTVQRIPPSTYSSPKSPKTTSLTAISSSSFNLSKPETHLTMTTSLDHSSLLLPENASREDLSAFNLSKTGGFHKIETSLETVQCSKPNSPSANFGHNKCNLITTTSKTKPEDSSSSVSERKEAKESKEIGESKELKDSKETKNVAETKEIKDIKEMTDQQTRKETVQTSDENSNSHASKEKNPEKKQVDENDDNMKDIKEKKENSQVNGECTQYLANTNTENKETSAKKGLSERSKE